jgi:purine-binding chemotaxis protein CheW
MKLVKHLVFKINDQKFAIKVQRVLNVIERAKIVDVPALKPFHKGMINYRDTLIPLIDLRDMLKMNPSGKRVNECVMVLELKINGKLELAGLSIDEICEITEFDKLYAYPYKRIFTEMRICDPRDGILVYNGEPLVLINADKVIRAFELQTDSSQTYSPITFN